MNFKGFLISAPQSGSGKTTVSLAIMAAFVKLGLTVAPFKCGPDFIDPGYHKAVTGNSSINLDGWMCDENFVQKTFYANLKDRDVAVIEGAMGLFDGFASSTKDGSSAQIAAITGSKVLLVLNAKGMAASAAALVKGFADFDPEVSIAGVIFNNVGSESHARLLREVLQQHTDIPCFGCIPRESNLEIPSRHLGLITNEDNPLVPEFIEFLAETAERYLDLEKLCNVQIIALPPLPATTSFQIEENILPSAKVKKSYISTVRIAVASDSAFCFCYEDNLRLLEEAGAEIVTFSPLHNKNLPENISGIYLPGGYPELYAAQLSENRSIRQEIKDAVESGMPVYGECGGFMYLTEGMTELNGEHNTEVLDFIGIFKTRARMLTKRKALGYREAVLTKTSILGEAGAIMRGHEFHYSEISAMPEDVECCYRVSRRGVYIADEGYCYKNCLGSYLHLHFGSNLYIAQSIVSACRNYGCT